MFDRPHWWLDHPVLTVGSVNSLEVEPEDGACDLVELRLDHLHSVGANIQDSVRKWQDFPLLFTARCPEEGGVGELSLEQEQSVLETVLASATAIDIEVRHLEASSRLVQRAKEMGVCVVASSHDFEKTPGSGDYDKIIDQAVNAGADILKCAARLHSVSDIETLASVLKNSPLPASAMGMGALGPGSRVLLASLGSVLNYGYLGYVETAPGQWPARLLKKAISHST